MDAAGSQAGFRGRWAGQPSYGEGPAIFPFRHPTARLTWCLATTTEMPGQPPKGIKWGLIWCMVESTDRPVQASMQMNGVDLVLVWDLENFPPDTKSASLGVYLIPQIFANCSFSPLISPQLCTTFVEALCSPLSKAVGRCFNPPQNYSCPGLTFCPLAPCTVFSPGLASASDTQTNQ